MTTTIPTVDTDAPAEPPAPSHAAIWRVVQPATVVVALVVGLVLRFWTTSQLWLDEALTVDIARLPVGQIPNALRRDGHPPLYYVLLHYWMDLFGQGNTAVRALSGVFAVLALPLAYFAGRRLGGRVTGWMAVTLLALTPYVLRYATEARMYSLVMLLVLAGYLLVRNALERMTPWRFAGLALVTGALLLSHYWSLWLAAATGLVLLWHVRSTRGDERRRALLTLGAVAVGFVFLVPWLGIMLEQSAHTGTPWGQVARPATLVADTLRDLGGGDYTEATLLGWVLAGLFVIGLTARTLDRGRLVLDVRTQPAARAEAAVVALTMSIAWVASVASKSTYATRYAAVIVPLVVLVAALGLVQLTGVFVRAVAVALVLVLGLVGGGYNVTRDRTQAGVVAAAIRAGSHPGDVVVMCPDQLGPDLHRLLPASLGLVQLGYPALDDPAFVDWRDYAKRNEAADPDAIAQTILARAGGHTVWLVAMDGYRTFGSQCDELQNALTAARGDPHALVTADTDLFEEPSSLLSFTGPQP